MMKFRLNTAALVVHLYLCNKNINTIFMCYTQFLCTQFLYVDIKSMLSEIIVPEIDRTKI